MPSAASDNFRWNGPEVAKVMARKHIPHREALAKKIGKPATSVRRSFDDEWEGEVTGPIAVSICRELNVAFHKLLRDPRHHS